MSEKTTVVVTFHTTAEALAFRKTCERNGAPGRLTTIPRDITAGCGYAWSVPVAQAGAVMDLIDAHAVEYEGVYEL